MSRFNIDISDQTSLLDFLDHVESQVRQQAESIVLFRDSAPPTQNPLHLSSRYQIPSSDVFSGQSTSEFSRHAAKQQYQHYQGRAYSVIRVITHRISAQPFRVARRVSNPSRSLASLISSGVCRVDALPAFLRQVTDLSKYDVLDSHPLLDLFMSPNELMVQHTLMEFTLANLLVTGRGFWVLSKSRTPGRDYDIVPVPTTWVQPVHEPQPFSSWTVKPPHVAGDGVPVPSEFMAHFHFPDPSTPFGAVSPLTMLARAVLNDEAIAEAQHSAFRNEGTPNVALITGDDIDSIALSVGASASRTHQQQGGSIALEPEQRQEIIDWFRQEYAGPARAGLPIVLDAIIKDVKILSRNPKEMAFLESSGVVKDQLFEGFGVPTVAAGQVKDANRGEAAVAESHFCSNSLNPIVMMMSQVIQHKLVPLFASQNDNLSAWIEACTPHDPELELDWWKAAGDNFALSINDWRAKLGVEPLPGGNALVVPQRARLVDASGETPVELLGIGTDSNPQKDATNDEEDSLSTSLETQTLLAT